MSRDTRAITRFLSSIRKATDAIVAKIFPQNIKTTVHVKAMVHVHNAISGAVIGHVHVQVNASLQLRLVDVQTRVMEELTFATGVRKLLFFSAEATELPPNHMFQLAQSPPWSLRVGVAFQPFFWREPEITRQQEMLLGHESKNSVFALGFVAASMSPCCKMLFFLSTKKTLTMVVLLDTSQQEYHYETFKVSSRGGTQLKHIVQLLVHPSGTIVVAVSRNKHNMFAFCWYCVSLKTEAEYNASFELVQQYKEVVETLFKPFNKACKHVCLDLGQDTASCSMMVMQSNDEVVELTPHNTRVLEKMRGWCASVRSVDNKIFVLGGSNRIVSLYDCEARKLLHALKHKHPVCRLVFCPGNDLSHGTYRLAIVSSRLLTVMVFTFDEQRQFSIIRTQIVEWERPPIQRVLTTNWCRVSQKLLVLFKKSKQIIVVLVRDVLTVQRVHSNSQYSHDRFAILADNGDTIIVGTHNKVLMLAVE